MRSGRRALSTADQQEIWRRWRKGESLSEIGAALDRRHSTLLRLLDSRGGIAPAPRRRSDRVLSLAEREEISRGLCAGLSAQRIAHGLGRATSSVTREIHRNGGRKAYRAAYADQRAWQRARRPKACVLQRHPRLAGKVVCKLQRQWSPQQISQWLERTYAHDETMRVSHETLYRSLFIQARGVLKKQLVQHLRSRRSKRLPQAARTGSSKRGQIIEAVSIRERPAEAADRAVPGHWEGDLLCGGRNTQIATLVERHSRFVILVKIPAKDTHSVVEALRKRALKLPVLLRRSLTWDRGLELAAHQQFSLSTRMQVYFCDPRSPWQRGSNENTNGLLRQYFPKGTVLSGYTQAQLNAVALRLNTRPRKTLDYRTPAFVLNSYVASTG